MPLFNKKTDFKPIPPRISRCNIGIPVVSEDLDDYNVISVQLNNKEFKFVDGIWIYSAKKTDVESILHLKQRCKMLEERKNLCHLKIEIMLDLLAEYISERTNAKKK